MKQLVALSLILFFLFSCMNSQQDRNAHNEQTTSQVTDLPDTKLLHLSIEGTKEETRFSLYQSEEGTFPFSFYTYYPSDMQVSSVSSGEGDAVIFQFNDATLSLNILPKDYNNRKKAETYVKDILAVASTDVKQQNGELVGGNLEKIQRAEIGSHDHRFYYWLTDMPREYADGMNARFHQVKEEFVVLKE